MRSGNHGPHKRQELHCHLCTITIRTWRIKEACIRALKNKNQSLIYVKAEYSPCGIAQHGMTNKHITDPNQPNFKSTAQLCTIDVCTCTNDSPIRTNGEVVVVVLAAGEVNDTVFSHRVVSLIMAYLQEIHVCIYQSTQFWDPYLVQGAGLATPERSEEGERREGGK